MGVEKGLVIGSSGSSPVCQPAFCSSNCLKWFQGFSSKLWSCKQTWATAAFSAVLLKTGQFHVLICPRINVQPVNAKIFRIKQREKRNCYIFIPCLQACSEMGLFFILEINGSKCTEMLQSQCLGVAWELCCVASLWNQSFDWSQISVHSGVLVRLTYTSGQYVAPHSPASSQACDLAASLKSVAMETREGQWVTDSESESCPSAESRYTGILARLQVVFCSDTEVWRKLEGAAKNEGGQRSNAGIHTPTNVPFNKTLPPSVLTRESDVKAFITHGKIRYESQLSGKIPKEACFHTRGQHWASQSGNRHLEIAVLGYGEVIMVLLKVESVEHQVDSWKFRCWGMNGQQVEQKAPAHLLVQICEGNASRTAVWLSSYLSRETLLRSRCSWENWGKNLENQERGWSPSFHRRSLHKGLWRGRERHREVRFQLFPSTALTDLCGRR